jgi:quercetin dioxygenase-like cupin family protein
MADVLIGALRRIGLAHTQFARASCGAKRSNSMSTTLGRQSASRPETMATGSDSLRREGKLAMGAQGIVVQPGEGPVLRFTPGRSIALKLLSGTTGDSIMMFEETVPAGTRSWFHLHHDSDEVAYVLEGEITFLIGDEVTVGGAGAYAFMPRGVPHAWKNTGAEAGRLLFLYTPAKAGGLLEEQHRRDVASMSEQERAEQLQRSGWEICGSSPL